MGRAVQTSDAETPGNLGHSFQGLTRRFSLLGLESLGFSSQISLTNNGSG